MKCGNDSLCLEWKTTTKCDRCQDKCFFIEERWEKCNITCSLCYGRDSTKCEIGYYQIGDECHECGNKFNCLECDIRECTKWIDRMFIENNDCSSWDDTVSLCDEMFDYCLVQYQSVF